MDDNIDVNILMNALCEPLRAGLLARFEWEGLYLQNGDSLTFSPTITIMDAEEKNVSGIVYKDNRRTFTFNNINMKWFDKIWIPSDDSGQYEVVSVEDEPARATPHACRCDITTIMRSGCVCGGV